MTSSERRFRRVAPGRVAPDAVAVGIAADGGKLCATVWWQARQDLEGDEVDYDTVPEALAAAEAARLRLGLAAVVVVTEPQLWRPEWGELVDDTASGPGELAKADLSDDEAFALAQGLETERDA